MRARLDGGTDLALALRTTQCEASWLMPTILFTSPTGEPEEGPTPEFIAALLREDDGYWQDPKGCGHGTFDVLVDRRIVKTLEITAKAAAGFHVVISELSPGAHNHFVALPKRVREAGTVVVHYGGEPYLVPAAFFLTVAEAAAAVKAFVDLGEKSPVLRWTRRQDLGWDPDTGSWASDNELTSGRD